MQTDLYFLNANHYSPERLTEENDRFEKSDQRRKLLALAEAHEAEKLVVVRRYVWGGEPSVAAFVDMPKARFFEFVQQAAEHGVAGECHLGTDPATLRRFGIMLPAIAQFGNASRTEGR